MSFIKSYLLGAAGPGKNDLDTPEPPNPPDNARPSLSIPLCLVYLSPLSQTVVFLPVWPQAQTFILHKKEKRSQAPTLSNPENRETSEMGMPA